jgi:hypothetical protein
LIEGVSLSAVVLFSSSNPVLLFSVTAGVISVKTAGVSPFLSGKSFSILTGVFSPVLTLSASVRAFSLSLLNIAGTIIIIRKEAAIRSIRFLICLLFHKLVCVYLYAN